YREGELIIKKNCTQGTEIKIDIDTNKVGTFLYQIIFYNSSDQIISESSFKVRVIPLDGSAEVPINYISMGKLFGAIFSLIYIGIFMACASYNKKYSLAAIGIILGFLILMTIILFNLLKSQKEANDPEYQDNRDFIFGLGSSFFKIGSSIIIFLIGKKKFDAIFLSGLIIESSYLIIEGIYTNDIFKIMYAILIISIMALIVIIDNFYIKEKNENPLLYYSFLGLGIILLIFGIVYFINLFQN
ncbi:MAG: hypothetical protein ACTSPQ_21850, partial [Candidatus Helarchaeota archaeon]